MIETGYLRTFAVSVAALFGLILGFVCVIDPYGVSLLRVSVPGINALKPKRVDIDRLIKPYEVWRAQPRTVFLGTSRFHQAMDPAVLDGTRFAPAYNASIPASTLSENETYLEQFFELDKNLRVVFVELYFYDFDLAQPELPKKSLQGLISDTAPLFLSVSSLFDAAQTLLVNASGRQNEGHIAPTGYLMRPINFTAQFNAIESIAYYVQFHSMTRPPNLNPGAFAALDRIVELCRRNHAELYLVLMPSYPWDDYRLLTFGNWPVVEEWLRRLSSYQNVISFSQYNELLEESSSGRMRYWNDPLHSNVHFGRLMLRSFLGTSDPEIPSNLLRPVRPDTVEMVIAERRAGLERWAGRNPEFTNAFERAKIGSVRNRGHP